MKSSERTIGARVTLALGLAIITCCFARVALAEPERAELDAMGARVLQELLEQKPDLKADFEAAPGYMVLAISATKIPAVGAGSGYGVVVDSRSGERTYLNISQLEIRGGLGAQKYNVIVLFKDSKLLEKSAAGGWHWESAADLASGSDSSSTSSKSEKEYAVYKLTESGAAATITIRFLHGKPFLQ